MGLTCCKGAIDLVSETEKSYSVKRNRRTDNVELKSVRKNSDGPSQPNREPSQPQNRPSKQQNVSDKQQNVPNQKQYVPRQEEKGPSQQENGTSGQENGPSQQQNGPKGPQNETGEKLTRLKSEEIIITISPPEDSNSLKSDTNSFIYQPSPEKKRPKTPEKSDAILKWSQQFYLSIMKEVLKNIDINSNKRKERETAESRLENSVKTEFRPGKFSGLNSTSDCIKQNGGLSVFAENFAEGIISGVLASEMRTNSYFGSHAVNLDGSLQNLDVQKEEVEEEEEEEDEIQKEEEEKGGEEDERNISPTSDRDNFETQIESEINDLDRLHEKEALNMNAIETNENIHKHIIGLSEAISVKIMDDALIIIDQCFANETTRAQSLFISDKTRMKTLDEFSDSLSDSIFNDAVGLFAHAS